LQFKLHFNNIALALVINTIGSQIENKDLKEEIVNYDLFKITNAALVVKIMIRISCAE
jgi:hypothetical protein